MASPPSKSVHPRVGGAPRQVLHGGVVVRFIPTCVGSGYSLGTARPAKTWSVSTLSSRPAKANGVNPAAYLADVLVRLAATPPPDSMRCSHRTGRRSRPSRRPEQGRRRSRTTRSEHLPAVHSGREEIRVKRATGAIHDRLPPTHAPAACARSWSGRSTGSIGAWSDRSRRSWSATGSASQ